MKIEAPADNTIIVELTSQDMTELNITYDEMDYSNLETKRVIWTVLDKVSHTLGRSIDTTGQLSIEAVPDRQGGCLLLFTLKQRGRQTDGKTDSRLFCVYETESYDSLADCAKAFSGCAGIFGTSLYESNGKYRLTAAIKSGTPYADLIAEYLEPAGTGELCVKSTDEYWTCLCRSNALESLCC